MRTYQITTSQHPLPHLTGRAFDPSNEPFCQLVPCAVIDSYPWDETGYRPEARAWMAQDDTAFLVLLAADEPTICAKAKEWNGNVWLDSCLECFLRPVEGDARYMNIEVNAAGAALIGLGADRNDRVRLPAPPEGLDLEVSRHDGRWWAVRYRIPFALIESLYGAAPTANMRGNFYTCDETLHPHFGSWNRIEADHPDFHRPECFGELLRA